MFMLGNFTDGLFGGASHIFELATKYHDLRTKFRDWDTADKVENAMQRGVQDGAGGAAGFGQALDGTTGSNAAGTYASRPDYETFDDDPDLASLPKLAKKTALSLKGTASSPLEGKGAYGRSQTQSADSPREGKNYGTPPVDTGRLDWLGQLGQKLRALGQGEGTQAPQQPPAYLPPQKPPNVGPAGAGSGAGPGTLDTLQQHGQQGELLAPGGVPYAGGPSLANGMNPLGQRIMAALTPTAGSTI